jgi:ParB family chromosome partitioning protein
LEEMARKPLGKGLAALIGDAPPAAEEPRPQIPQVQEPWPQESQVAEQETGSPPQEIVAAVPITGIRPGGHQPRRHFDENSLQELADSIKTGGVIQPLILRRLEDGAHEIIAGERRWRAAQIAGLESVPAIIKDLDNRATLEVSIVENLQREDLNPIEEAEAYRRLMDEFALSQEEAARRVGKDRSTVANTLRLLNLPKSIQADVATGLLSAGHARALLSLGSPAAQMGLAEKIKARGLSVRETEALVSVPDRPGGRRRPAPIPDVHVRRAEEDLKRKLETKVRIRGNANKGRIEIEYYSNNDLIRIVDLLK